MYKTKSEAFQFSVISKQKKVISEQNWQNIQIHLSLVLIHWQLQDKECHWICRLKRTASEAEHALSNKQISQTDIGPSGRMEII